MKRTLSFAKPLLLLYPFLKMVLPGHGCTLEDLGSAMIGVTKNGYKRSVLNNNDIDTFHG